ncbi:MAG: PhzF family phenazine biosynthesis protein [Frankiaceae bacterium]|nr:PhzF family phenazine biosynthesis protein [Frankiaceae bacterium]MBV9870157.1 PhzF family phenazine biosynthesis protein [Frankiaceae bacterium]
MTDGMLAYRVVDVFADAAFAGNPLAVVLDGDDLTTSQMQAIAKEFNLSETTFPVTPSSSAATYRLRIFTPGTELPFAGHPSVGSAWVMRSLGRVGDGRAVQECGAGLLPIDIDGDRATLTGGSPTLGESIEPERAAAAVGLSASDVVGDPAQWAGMGLEFGFLHVKPEALVRASLNPVLAADLPPGAGLSVFAFANGVARARVFAPGAGVAEDPATGSAALGLGVWLAAHGYVATEGETPYVVIQGVEMGRASRLECVVRCEAGAAVEGRVSGTVVPVAEGWMRRPEV